jgi:CRP-like cAMP-binding protein
MNTNTNNKVVAVPDTGAAVKPVGEIEKVIAEHPFLSGLSPHHFRILSDCATLTRFEPGEIIFREGDPANRFYLIRSGRVLLESQAAGRSRVPLQTVGPGEVLGWSWLFPPYYWHFDARALETTEAIFFYGTPLREECDSDHDFGYELIKRMSGVMQERLQASRRRLLAISRPGNEVYSN